MFLDQNDAKGKTPQKADFDRQIACTAPVCWSEYTTGREVKWSFLLKKKGNGTRKDHIYVNDNSIENEGKQQTQ